MPQLTRRKFVESQGATCANWTWSWSFVSHPQKTVIFGAWAHHTDQDTAMILDDEWAIRRGRRATGFGQALEHIRLIEERGYSLMTFPIVKAGRPEGQADGPASIGHFIPELTARRLRRTGARWYGDRLEAPFQGSEELPGNPEEFIEGAATRVTANAYERSGPARALCLKHYGYACIVCGFDFERAYGAIGRELIHVHHIVSLSTIRRKYIVNPIKDLVPVCPNCHALIHRTRPALSVEVLLSHIASQQPFEWPRRRVR